MALRFPQGAEQLSEDRRDKSKGENWGVITSGACVSRLYLLQLPEHGHALFTMQMSV